MYRGHRVLENLRTLPANIRPVPRGWKQYVRMDGDLYWHNPELKLTTYDDIRDRELLEEVLEIEEEHMGWCDNDGFVFPCGTETFIGTVKEDADVVQHVSLSSGIIFSIGDELNIRYDAKQSFWNYFSQYCMHVRRLPPKVEVEFLSAMTFGSNEWILGYQDTTFPFNELQCERIMEIYQVLQRLHQKEAGYRYIPLMLWFISETMLVIESRRTTQEYSSAKMWTSKHINIPKPSWKLQALDCILGFLLFGTQFTFRKRLQLALANRSENISHLREVMDTFLVQWSDSNLLVRHVTYIFFGTDLLCFVQRQL
ncbi:hypothetical protein PILCRDRAFT_827508 [Piloderma croceum F 1598]|uniref:WW domain-containing protein n=1 Tax=Piloderma croceum (strain F 1598) TaxID=765440 RepID=A0A0C3ERR6_PILCF|nr:hypothetical protein PILCRDRAFT_827508 [Piloderma croceum F 1598]